MKISKIELSKIAFLEYLKNGDERIWFLRRAIKQWQESICIDLSLDTTITEALKNTGAGSLWNYTYDHKAALLKLFESAPSMMQDILEDLLLGSYTIDQRFDRYTYHIQDLTDSIQLKGVKQDNYSASLWLSFAQPLTCVPYNYAYFKKLMEYLESNNIPQEFEIERWNKWCLNLAKIIQKDTNFMESYYRIIPEDVFMGPSIAISYEWMEWVQWID